LISVKNQVCRSLSSIQSSIRLAAYWLNLLVGFRGGRNRNSRSGRRASDAGALAFHPSNDTRAELVNYSIK
jgi:hypothetical protein